VRLPLCVNKHVFVGSVAPNVDLLRIASCVVGGRHLIRSISKGDIGRIPLSLYTYSNWLGKCLSFSLFFSYVSKPTMKAKHIVHTCMDYGLYGKERWETPSPKGHSEGKLLTMTMTTTTVKTIRAADVRGMKKKGSAGPTEKPTVISLLFDLHEGQMGNY
jgi:hypothetical protein